MRLQSDFIRPSKTSGSRFRRYLTATAIGWGLMSVGFTAIGQEQTQSIDYIEWQAAYTGEAAANVKGGKRRGSAYAGQLFLGAKIDMERAAQWRDTQIHVALTNRHGQSLAQNYIGNSTSVQEIYGGQNSRLVRLTMETSLFDGKLQLEGGRTVANISFLGSELCQYFQTNSACGNPTFVFRTSNFTWWPVSSWGGHAKVWLNDKVFLHAGVYEENTAHQDAGNHGFDWGIDESTGVVVPVTLGYHTNLENDDYPRRYEIGGWYDGADYTDPARDDNGEFAAKSGEDYATRNSRSGVFARFEQTVFRADLQSSRRLIVFGDVLTGISGELAQDYYIKAGFVKHGTFTGRDRDTIAFVITRQDYSEESLEDQAILRRLNGGFGRPAGSQTMMELGYGVQVNDHIRVQPNVHYIINPDQFNDRARTQALDNAWVIGLRFDVDIAALMFN